jgi:hypothetical protein
MRVGASFVIVTLAVSTAALGQTTQDGPFQLGFAANLNVGDSFVNLTNDGWNGGFWAAPGSLFNATIGNICVNAYVFDPQEEEISCCSCLVTPNGLQSLSAKSDLINNVLTPSTPNSIVIKLVASLPSTDATGNNYTVCNPSTVNPSLIFQNFPPPPPPYPPGYPATGMMAWGTTLEPNAGGGYGVVHVPFLQGDLNYISNNNTGNFTSDELNSLTQLCGFIQQNGSGYGICNSCSLGGLGGAKH